MKDYSNVSMEELEAELEQTKKSINQLHNSQMSIKILRIREAS